MHALSGIDLEINVGDFFALLGPNGAGKTTLINIFTARQFTEHGMIKLLFLMIAFWVLLLPVNMAIQYNDAAGGPAAVTTYLELLYQIMIWLNSFIIVYFMLWFLVQMLKKIGEGRRLKEMGEQ